jgi:hypothetical protein
MGNVIKGWKPASRFSGIAVRTLRKGVEDGALCGTKKDGIWSFVDSDLLAFAAAIGKAVPTAPTTVVNATTATSRASASLAAMGALPPWMTAAVNARDAAAGREAMFGDDGEDEDDNEARLPFDGVPLGSSRMASPTSAWPYSAIESATRIAELEQQLADAIAQRDRWQTLYRTTRIKSIADGIADEVMHASRGDVSAAQAAAHAAAHALTTLTNDQLALDSLAIPHAQHFGHHVGTSWYQHRNANDIERARARRRSRSPRC